MRNESYIPAKRNHLHRPTGSGIAMSLTYGTVLTEGYNWPQESVGLVNVSHIHSHPFQRSFVQLRNKFPLFTSSQLKPTDPLTVWNPPIGPHRHVLRRLPRRQNHASTSQAQKRHPHPRRLARVPHFPYNRLRNRNSRVRSSCQ